MASQPATARASVKMSMGTSLLAIVMLTRLESVDLERWDESSGDRLAWFLHELLAGLISRKALTTRGMFSVHREEAAAPVAGVI